MGGAAYEAPSPATRPARTTPPAPPSAGPGARPFPVTRRLRSEDRRTVLLDAAASILADHGLDAVTMDAVAVFAGVSRPLVYKHFTNRDELLAAVLRREATELDAAIVTAVERVDGFESKIRVMIHEVLDAVGTHGAIFQPLLRTGSRDSAYRQEQRARDRRTVRFFARLAQAELDLDLTQATAAMGVLLSGVESVRAQYRTRPTAEHRKLLEDLYVDIVIGGLTRLKERISSTSAAWTGAGPLAGGDVSPVSGGDAGARGG